MQSRRTTLGPVSASTANSRASLGPARVSLSKPAGSQQRQSMERQSLSGRQSMGAGRPSMGMGRPSVGGGRPSMGARRSSAMGKGTATSKVNDPRPISDKSYQMQCIKILITFLTEHNYDSAISPKTMMSPTTKDFTRIVYFLLRLIDGRLPLADKFEDEIPAWFKQLRYPFTITKSALISVGAPNTWPHLLAALTWMVELLTYDEEVIQQDGAAPAFEDKGTLESKLFFEYLSKAYSAFLRGMDSFAPLEDGLADMFHQKHQAVEDDMARTRDQLGRVRRETDHLRAAGSPLAALQDKGQVLQSDLDKFTNLVGSLKTYQGQLDKKLRERQADGEARKRELATVLAEKSALQEQLDAQELTPEDVERMKQERARLESSLKELITRREELQKAIWDEEMRVAKKAEDCEKIVKTYSVAAERLHLLPRTAKNAEGIDYEISLDLTAATADGMLRGDLKGGVKPGLARLKETLAERIRVAHEEQMKLQEESDALQERHGDHQEAIAELEARLKKLEALYRAEKDGLSQTLQSTKEEAEKVEEEIVQLKQAATSKAATKSQTALQLLQEDVEACQQQLEAERQAARELIAADLDLLTNHKLAVQQKLAAVAEELGAMHRAVCA